MCYECYRMGLKHFNRGTERVPHRRHLWRWFELVTRKGGYSYRLAAFIRMYDQRGELVLTWKLDKAMPIKFKMADLNAFTINSAMSMVAGTARRRRRTRR